LQRAITDFGADQSFAQAMDKLVEHYGVIISESSIRRITGQHARAIFMARRAPQRWPTQVGKSAVVIAQMDGTMVPIVAPDPTQADQRKGKTLQWREAKICLAHPSGSNTRAYGGTLSGDVGLAGEQLFDCAARGGFGLGTHVHGVGDGAPWIADQVDAQFGAQGSYLIDFYHVCDYLSAASKVIVAEPAGQAAWMAASKHRLKTEGADELMAALVAHLEAPSVEEGDAPVRRCHRYLSHRREQLDYQGALAQALPIGSGEIESAHRYIVQQRLKKPGAWWCADNAEHMLALRLNRANCQWNDYWATDVKLAA
jgi:hypothetical protein